MIGSEPTVQQQRLHGKYADRDLFQNLKTKHHAMKVRVGSGCKDPSIISPGARWKSVKGKVKLSLCLTKYHTLKTYHMLN